ncbi:hypothetical protein K388_07280 [Streptomyces sp. KhCrAH-43]|uniref:hypothetical protein n=1 Tax=unclassified Streptomyces TaxID=2593676 RepID=UPI00035F69CD|nr:hypothetical protein [Streptomyces sp. KhCrAH-43]MYS32585.1 hypothetical protein [Streptomyces sp. SID4920]MYX64245.1 hypothetical protein [Streptomyces sp. SID8373]RAJ46451.1 hypothetical protein K388_07280 [Streptomyces sp. KhCrAH-43]
MPTPAAVLKRRLCAFEARAAELRERIAALREEAAQVDAEIVRWRIGSEIWDEVEREVRGGAGGAAASRGLPVPDSESAPAAAVDDGPGAWSEPEGRPRYVPHRSESGDLAGLPGLYEKIVEFVRDAPGPVRTRDVARALFGEGASRTRMEGVRGQLKRLVRQEWLVSVDGREFTGAA